jgi:ethanolamine ammonia-lyase small subunit
MSANEPPSDPWSFLRNVTSARLALGRTGDGLPTARVLEFALAHARARDGVHAALDVAALVASLSDLRPCVVRSEAEDRMTYLKRPDLGRKLSATSRETMCRGDFDAVVVLADGLSAAAVQNHGVALCRSLFAQRRWRFAPPVVARQARVALGDAIATAVGAGLVIMLIGERPGLSAADSLSAYITFAPKPGETQDAERNCVSNIHAGGLSIAEAARRVLAIMALAHQLRCSGTALKEDAALALAGPSGGKDGLDACPTTRK